MQPSALYRMGVVMPLDDDAEAQLRACDVEESAPVRAVSLGDEVFSTLWIAGFFRDVNERCSGLIDEYEDEIIEPTQLAGVVAAVDDVLRRDWLPDERAFLRDLRELAFCARNDHRPLMFVL